MIGNDKQQRFREPAMVEIRYTGSLFTHPGASYTEKQ